MATAATTSAPLRIPESRKTSARSPTAATISGSTSSGVGERSSWRAPWLETTTAVGAQVDHPPRVLAP